MKYHNNILIIVLLILIVAGCCGADVNLASVLGNNMVLLQKSDAAIWGWADVGEKVTVSASWQDSVLSVNADENGKWLVKIRTPKAGGPHTLTIKGNNRITLKNVMTGEVWLCGGQSNMAMGFYREKKQGDKTIVYKIDNHEQERLAADYPNIRVFRAKAQPWQSETPVDHVRGNWAVCAPAMAQSMPAVPYFFGRQLHKKLDVPVGLIVNAVPATQIEPWTNAAGFDSVGQLKEVVSELAKPDTPEKLSPGVFYNTLVHPLVPYTIRGAIWYQGESNKGDHMIYYHKMRALINGWRWVWGQGDFPFYFVQLAPCGAFYEDMELPKLWEAQAAAMEIKNTGMAMNSDISDLDLHPANKQDVGKRLAQWALAKDYGLKGIVYDGPRYKSMRVQSNEIHISFSNPGGQLASRDGKPLDCFTIAGDNQIFIDAVARIEGDTVVVFSDKVSRPVAVRFGWNKEAQPNLMNAEGLPAYPFRTDNWPLDIVQADEVVVSAKTDKVDAVYEINEPAVFLFSASKPGVVTYTVTLDSRDLIEEKKVSFTGVTLEVCSTLDKPGVLRCKFSFESADKSKKKTAVASAVYEPLKIQPAAIMPEDFDSFWSQRKAQLACIPINATLVPIKSDSNAVETFDVKMDCIGKKVYGYYTRPKASKTKGHPAVITLHGAGVSSARKETITYFADNGFIALDINANGVVNGKSDEYYADLYKTSLLNYRHWGKENQYTSYFTGMFTRVLRGLEFLKSQPQWNGKVLVAYGASQGGAQSLAAAGLDSDVNFIFAGVPAMCDHGGYINGWPKFVPREPDGSYHKQILDASMYNDGVNFARRAKAKAIFSVGFNDEVCRPTSVYAAFNSYEGEKEMLTAPRNAHPVPPKYYKYAQVEILEFAANIKDAEANALGVGSIISVSDDGKHFIESYTGRKFTPWGFNYDHDDSGMLIEDYWDKRWDEVVSDFKEMKSYGANVVRIHLQVYRFMDSPDKPNTESLKILSKLVQLAEETGLYLDITGLACYHKAEVPTWYDEMSEEGRWQVQVNFWQAVAKVCADSPAIFCYDLMNEPALPGKNKESEWLVGDGFGGKHFVQRITLDLNGRTRNEVAKAWVDTLTTAIREYDKRHMITVGVIPWAHVWPNAKPFFYSEEVGENLDFVSVHFYPKKDKVQKALDALAVYDIGKPLVIEEMFPLSCGIEQMDQFIDESKANADGWITFYWGNKVDEYDRGDFAKAVQNAWLKYFIKKTPEMQDYEK